MTIDLTSPTSGGGPNAAAERSPGVSDAAAASGFLAALQSLMTAVRPLAAGPVAAADRGPEGFGARPTASADLRPRIAAPVMMGAAIDARGGASVSVQAAAVDPAVDGRPASGAAVPASGAAVIEVPVPLIAGDVPPVSTDRVAQPRSDVEPAPSPPPIALSASAARPSGEGPVPPDIFAEVIGDGRSAEVADVVARAMPSALVGDQPATGAAPPAAAPGASGDPPTALGKTEPALPTGPAQATGTSDRQLLPEHDGAPVESPVAEAPAPTAPEVEVTTEPAGSSTLAAPAPLAVEEGHAAEASAPRLGGTTVAGLTMAVVDAVHDGKSGIRVALQPEQLGRVDIDLAIGEDGRLQASFTVERPETLQLLHRDQRLLGQALGDAGILLSDGGLRFSLDDHSAGRQGHSHEHGKPRTSDAPVLPSTASQIPRRQASGLLDLLV